VFTNGEDRKREVEGERHIPLLPNWTDSSDERIMTFWNVGDEGGGKKVDPWNQSARRANTLSYVWREGARYK